MVTATVFGHARGVAVHGICSLDALAHEAAATGAVAGEFVVATDARRKEVYWARYAVEPALEGGPRARRLTDPAVDYPATVAELLDGAPVVGRGAVLYPDLLGPQAGPLDVSAGHLAEVALRAVQDDTTLPVEPLYLRRPDAAPAHPRKTVTQAAPHGRA
jgi:tRNA threonylcarbamoyl adenosine modification protein YeaZ